MTAPTLLFCEQKYYSNWSDQTNMNDWINSFIHTIKGTNHYFYSRAEGNLWCLAQWWVSLKEYQNFENYVLSPLDTNKSHHSQDKAFVMFDASMPKDETKQLSINWGKSLLR